jgi:glycerol-3-phosphate dehydrogenase
LDKHSLSRLTQSILAPYGTTGKRDKKLHTKGGGTVVTVDGNVLIGPDALETPLREDTATNDQSVRAVLSKQKTMLPLLEKSDIITYFTGVRAATYEEDFVIRKGIFTKNIVEAAGIQSPGLSAAPAISQDVSQMAVEILRDKREVKLKENFNPLRKGVTRTKELDETALDALIKENPDYGEIICRCEQISKGEILEALRLPLKVYSVDAVKRRARAGMGRCQGGFCQPLVAQIIAKEINAPLTKVIKKGNAAVVKGSNKE